MLMRKLGTKYTGIALLALLMSTLVPISISYAKNQERKRAEKFVEIALKAKEKVDDLLARMGIEDIEDLPDEIASSYKEANDTLESAQGENVAPSEAIQNAKQAMLTFRTVFEQLHALLDEGVDTETEEKGQGILVAIDRAYERIQRIKDANDTYVTMYPLNETINGWILANLTSAETNLSEANESIVLYHNVPWAEGNLTEANQNISDAFAALKSLAEWTNAWRVESFLMGIKNSVERTLELAERAGVDINDTLYQLGYPDYNEDDSYLDDFLRDVEGNLTAARGYRKTGGVDMKKAIGHIKNIRQTLTEIHTAIHSKGAGHGKKP